MQDIAPYNHQSIYTPPSEKEAEKMFHLTIDKLNRLETFFEAISSLASENKILFGLANEGAILCYSAVTELRSAYQSMGLDSELIE